jgi:hypothetical protein
LNSPLGENFAEKWNRDAELTEAFGRWHQTALSDFKGLAATLDQTSTYSVLEKICGKSCYYRGQESRDLECGPNASQRSFAYWNSGRVDNRCRHRRPEEYVLRQMSRYHSGRKDLSATQQYLRLKRDFPGGRGSVSKEKLLWRQTLKPTPISEDYAVRLLLAPSASPKVFVEAPSRSDLAGGRPLPHVYQQQPPQLCLYRTRYQEWTPSVFLANTILPWASLWLFFFEDWLIPTNGKAAVSIRHPKF